MKDLIQLLTTKSESLRASGRLGSGDSYMDTARSITRFLVATRKPKSILLKKITVEFLCAYEKWMSKEGKSSRMEGVKGSPASITTIGIYMRNIRSVYNDAVEAGLASKDDYPFGLKRYVIPSESGSRKARLPEEIMLVMNHVCDTDTKQRSRDFWVFSYLCNGANIKDILNLKWSNIDVKNEKFIFIREKSKRTKRVNQSAIEGVLFPEAIEIIERWGSRNPKPDSYLFPILNESMNDVQKERVKDYFIKVTNRCMKEIGRELGLSGDLRTYCARHSFATILMQSEAPLAFISKSLGHSKITTTQAYLGKFTEEKSKEYLRALVRK